LIIDPEIWQQRQITVHAGEPLVFEVKLVKVRAGPGSADRL
jgi:hypothetical protein